MEATDFAAMSVNADNVVKNEEEAGVADNFARHQKDNRPK
jgi:hypothetical protein